MWLLVGLGNPGKEYESTRHNAGWMALDFLAREIGTDWKKDKKFNAEIADGVFGDTKIMMVKPQSFMNLSGEVAQPIAAYYKIEPDHIIVIHDDMDFDLGDVRMQFDRTAAGHNGVQNLIDRLGTKAFHRIRIGIGPKKIEARDFVLAKFSKDELKTMAESVSTVLDAIDTIVHAE